LFNLWKGKKERGVQLRGFLESEEGDTGEKSKGKKRTSKHDVTETSFRRSRVHRGVQNAVNASL